jgi:hypothetical protein
MVSKAVGYQLHTVCCTKIEAVGLLPVSEHLVLEPDDGRNSTVHRFRHFLG